MNTVVESPIQEVSEQEVSEQAFVKTEENIAASLSDSGDMTDQNQSLEMVRKILFGEQVRKTEKRQASLERHIQVSVESLNEETSKRIDALKAEIGVLTDLFEEEVQARKANQLNTQDNLSNIEHSIDKLGHQVLKNHSELNERLENEKNKLGQQMRDWRLDILQTLQDATDALGKEKADRQSIAMLLTEMAGQLVADDTASH